VWGDAGFGEATNCVVDGEWCVGVCGGVVVCGVWGWMREQTTANWGPADRGAAGELTS